LEDLLSMKIHDIDSGFIRQMRDAGLGDLNPDQLLALKIHDLNPDFFQEMWDLGLLSREKTPGEVAA
jgi:hypothetical protein